MGSASLQAVTYATRDSGALEATHERFEAALERVRGRLGSDHPMRIGARPVETGAWVDDRSPIDPSILVGRVPGGTRREVDEAVRTAREGFATWRRWSWRDRLELLRRAADILERDAVETSAWLTLEVGKSRLEALGEAFEVPALIRYYCDQVEAAEGYERPEQQVGDERARLLLRPFGVWAIVSPFNFPFATGAGMAVAALATGNVAIMKPATDAPIPTLLFEAALEEAGIPAGAISVLTGPAGSIGTALVGHPGIDGVAFTGSVAAGAAIGRALSASPVRRPLLAELGGKNPVVVTATADLDQAVDGIIRSAFGFSGQKCSATSRVYVVQPIAQPFLDRLVEQVEQLVLGDPRRRETFVGPVINETAVDRFSEATATARRHGRILVGGRRSPVLPGFLVEPTVATDLPLAHPLFREELFLPLLAVAAVADLDEAIREANAPVFGLCAGIFSRDEREIERFFDEVECGVLYANRRAGATSGAWPGVQAFTGWKASGSSGKGALGPWYVQQFVREQARTIVREGQA